MRLVAALYLLLAAPLVRADGSAPLSRLTPPEKMFFDDPIALSSDGAFVALLATDVASKAVLEVWEPRASKDALVKLEGMPITATRLEFLGNDRLLVVAKRTDGRVEGILVQRRGTTLTAEHRRIGPAASIEVADRDGKRVIVAYERRVKKPGAEHTVTVHGIDGDVVAQHGYAEGGDGLLRSRAGSVRPLWWYAGHTRLAAQKVGEYDPKKDIRRPSRFVRLDAVADKVIEEQEIEDLLSFAKLGLAHKAVPAEETFVRLSEDHKQLVVDTGLTEIPLPLTRAVDRYEPDSLEWQPLHDHELLVKIQVDPNNIEAVNRRVPDADEIDVYKLDLTNLKQAVSMPRVLVLPGGKRPAKVVAAGGKLLVLRKDRGFDRGGVAVELYALP